MPGEVRGCIGCHEHRRFASPNRFVEAMRHGPSELQPPTGGVRIVDFIRDVQPVLDQHCVRCHSGATPGGKLDLVSGRTRLFNIAYESIISKRLVSWVDVTPRDAFIEPTPPLKFGAIPSKLIQVIEKGHYDAKPTPEELRRVTEWIDSNCPYYSTYAYDRPGRTGGRDLVPPGKDAFGVFAKRCVTCHPSMDVNLLVNFSDPNQSRLLMASLAKEAGGWGLCPQPTFKDKSDSDYQAVETMLQAATEEIKKLPRVDMFVRK
jgi:hypothetical protein